MKTSSIIKMSNKNLDLSRISQFVEFCRNYSTNIGRPTQELEMDAVERFKRGNKIKIKKKNVGSFTRYCGGNVTEACIQKGKSSSDPKIRKKATFAANAREWSH